MLKLEHVKKQYKDFHLDCSLTVKPGMITGLIGANGAGKRTDSHGERNRGAVWEAAGGDNVGR